VCAYYCAELSYAIQHRTVLINFHPKLQTIITDQMQSFGGEGVTNCSMNCVALYIYIYQLPNTNNMLSNISVTIINYITYPCLLRQLTNVSKWHSLSVAIVSEKYHNTFLPTATGSNFVNPCFVILQTSNSAAIQIGTALFNWSR